MPLTTYPVATDGNMLGYVSGWHREIEWRGNTPFEATLRIFELTRGRSSIKYHLIDDLTGQRWEMFVTDMLDLLTTCAVNHGVVHGRWHVVKRGTNYGISLIADAAESDEPA